jgi:hypothetical protein
LKRLYVMTNIYNQDFEGGNTKWKVDWVWFIVPKLKVFIRVLIFMAIKKILHTRFHWFKFVGILHTLVIVNCMIRSRIEDTLKCIHLVGNKSIKQIKMILTMTKLQRLGASYNMHWVVWAILECKQNLCVDEILIK